VELKDDPLPSTEIAPRIFTPAYYARLEEIEATHWWYRGLRDLTARWLADTAPRQAALRVLDVGCGAGFMLRWLDRYANGSIVVGLDFDGQALVYARGHGRGVVVQGSAMDLPFGSGSFDLVHCADVLQHLPTAHGDADALREIARVLAPGGLLVVRTNATPGLGAADGDDTYQRYRLTRLEDQARAAGLTVLRSTHVNVLPSLIDTLRRRWRPRSTHRRGEHLRHGPGVPRLPRVPGWNALMFRVLATEAFLLSRGGWSSPFGHSAMVLAARSSADKPVFSKRYFP
jgi:SAM-dependent methyltransferase